MSTVTTSRVLTPQQGALVLALSVLVFGFSWPVLKIAMVFAAPLWFTAVRLAGATVVLALYLAARGKLVWPTRQDLPMVLGLGILQYGIMSSLMVYGVSVVGAGRTAMLVYTNSIWMTLGAVLFLGEKPSRGQLAGLVCGISGLAILFSPFGLDWHDRRTLIGNGCVVVGSVVWSVALLQVRRHRWHADPIQLAPLQTLIGGVIALIAALALEGPVPAIRWTQDFILAYVAIVVLATCVAFLGLAVAGRALPAIALSLGQLATPVIGVVSSALVVAEIPSRADIAGLVLIVCGVAIAAIFGRRRLAPAPIPVAERAAE